jgi:hypothetical protein
LTEGDLESAGLVSREWRRAATEPALWRGLFCRVARVDRPSRTDHADWRRDALLQPVRPLNPTQPQQLQLPAERCMCADVTGCYARRLCSRGSRRRS